MKAEYYLNDLIDVLPGRLKIAGLESEPTVSKFMAAIEEGTILGVPVPKEVIDYLCRYAVANIQKGDKLKEFTLTETAVLPDSFFDTVLNPDPMKNRPTVSDTMYLVRYAIAELGLKLNGENNGCEDLSRLPLVV